MANELYIHATAELGEGVSVGDGTKIWHFVQVRPGVRIGADCILGRDVYIDENVTIGNAVKIQNRVSIYKDCTIEDGVFIGPHVVFTNDQFPRSINPDGTLKSATDWEAGVSSVGYGAAIGAGSVILPSKSIGRFSLIGAGSVVTRDIRAHEIVVGNPARQVGYACKCGHRLQKSDDQGFECGSCARTYTLDSSSNLNPNEP